MLRLAFSTAALPYREKVGFGLHWMFIVPSSDIQHSISPNLPLQPSIWLRSSTIFRLTHMPKAG